MKILLVTDKFPPEPTTVGNLVFEFVQKLSTIGHKGYIFTTTPHKNEKNFQNNLIKVYTPRFTNALRYWITLYNPFVTSQFKKALNEINPDVIHFHNIHQYLGFNLLKLAKRFKKPVFLTAHDVMLFHYGKLIEFLDNTKEPCSVRDYRISAWQQIKRFKKYYNPFRNLIIRHYLRYVDKIFAVSNELKKVLNDNGIDNVEVIHNGINIESWKVDNSIIHRFKKNYHLNNKKVVLFGGRLSDAKGGRQAILALADVVKQFPEIILLVIGQKTDYVNQMIQLAREKGVERNLVFTGWISGDELKAAFHAVDVVIVPSVCFDTFSMTTLEASTCKKPVVATCFGGAKEIVVDGVTGYIINPLNIESLASKIIDLFKNPQKARQFGEAGYERVKKYFSLESQVNKTIIWYQKMLYDKEENLESCRKI